MKRVISILQILLIILMCLSLSACQFLDGASDQGNTADSTSVLKDENLLKVSFIDVGQADSILIQTGASSMLIDAGNNPDSGTIINYINKQGISRLDYIVGTHPHEDHIGAMDAVINKFEIGKVLMPQVTTTTKSFRDVLTAIKNKGLTITVPAAGSTFQLGKASCTVLAPNSSHYDDLNNYSIVIKLTFGKTSFLFTGDAQTASENEMLSKGYDLKADVLKVGHHGSGTATSPDFLKAVSPEYAVISVGKNNDYGHPHQEILDRLNEAGVRIYRTDESGTVTAISDGQKVSFK